MKDYETSLYTTVTEEYVDGLKLYFHRPRTRLVAAKLLDKIFGKCKHHLDLITKDGRKHVYWCLRCGCLAVHYVEYAEDCFYG